MPPGATAAAEQASPSDPSVDPSSSGTPAASADQAKSSWADELASSIGPQKSDLDDAQLDGAVGGTGLEEPEYEVEISLKDLQQDPSADNPLYSGKMTFDQLIKDDRLLRALAELNFKSPSKVQTAALPHLLGDDHPNMMAQSQSGTGKTATFVLTILSRVDYNHPNQPQALVLAPTRELARQIEGVFKAIGKYIQELKVQAAVPGIIEKGARVSASVVVGTPGTVNDLIKRRQLDTTQLKVLCLDEADNMMDLQGLGDQCLRIKQGIPGANPQIKPKLTQVLLFSATFPEHVEPFAKSFCPGSIDLRLKKSEINVKSIHQMYIDCPEGEGKYDVLVKLYGLMNIGSSIIFVKERRHADDIARRMTAQGHAIASIHGAFEANDRDRVLESFRKGEAKVLITTNVLSRGIDVSSVSIVINYDIPMMQDKVTPDMETYIHRIGRTGRFGRTGVSISFVNDRKSFGALKAISDTYNIHLVQLSITDWDETEAVVQRIIKSSLSNP